MNLTKAFEGYMFDKQARYSPNTLDGYRIVFRNLLNFSGEREIENIKHDDLTRFILYLQNDYVPNRLNSPDKSPLNPATVDLHWKGIRSFFHWAYDVLDLPRP